MKKQTTRQVQAACVSKKSQKLFLLVVSAYNTEYCTPSSTSDLFFEALKYGRVPGYVPGKKTDSRVPSRQNRILPGGQGKVRAPKIGRHPFLAGTRRVQPLVIKLFTPAHSCLNNMLGTQTIDRHYRRQWIEKRATRQTLLTTFFQTHPLHHVILLYFFDSAVV